MVDCREPCEQEQCDGLCDRQPDHSFQHKHEVVVGQPEHKGYSVGHSYPWGLKPESRRKSKGSRVTEVAGVIDRTESEERTGEPRPTEAFRRNDDPPQSHTAIENYDEHRPNIRNRALALMRAHIGEWIDADVFDTAISRSATRRVRELREMGYPVEIREDPQRPNVWQYRLTARERGTPPTGEVIY